MKYDIRNYFNRKILFEVEQAEQEQEQMQQMPQHAPQMPPQPAPSEAFRSLQGQRISGVQFMPNGTNGGTIKIKVKDSYIPFTISWVNQTVTVTDLNGNTMVLGDNQQ